MCAVARPRGRASGTIEDKEVAMICVQFRSGRVFRGMAWAGALCLLAWGARAQAEGFEWQWGLDAPRAPGVGLELQPGRGGQVPAWRVELFGGEAGGTALLALELAGSTRVHALPLTLDTGGGAQVTLGGAWLAGGFSARALVRVPGGVVTTETRIAAPPEKTVPLQRGDVVITEILKDPTAVPDGQGEWFELLNPGAQPVDLEGWELRDATTNKHTIHTGGSLVVLPGQRLVLGNNPDVATNGGVLVHYKYSGFTLGNGADEIFLSAPGGVLVDAVRYDDGVFWPDTAGRSLSLTPGASDAYANDNAYNWCHATTAIVPGGQDKGTPGQANDRCP